MSCVVPSLLARLSEGHRDIGPFDVNQCWRLAPLFEKLEISVDGCFSGREIDGANDDSGHLNAMDYTDPATAGKKVGEFLFS